MPQSLSQVYLHLIFSTKGREPFLKDTKLRADLHGYMQGICKNLECPSLRIGGVEDHAHVLCCLGRSISIADLVRELKRDSSKWIKEQCPALHHFHWQTGYGVFSISPGHVEGLKDYIANQIEHHRTKENFQDEYRRICAIYEVPIEERYVWD